MEKDLMEGVLMQESLVERDLAMNDVLKVDCCYNGNELEEKNCCHCFVLHLNSTLSKQVNVDKCKREKYNFGHDIWNRFEATNFHL